MTIKALHHNVCACGSYTNQGVIIFSGYRNVPLIGKDGAKLESASLFVHVWFY